jgi:hypothetical protein
MIDTMLLAFISGSVIPLATGLLTKVSAKSSLKAALSILLAGVVAVVAYLQKYAGVGTWKEAAFVFMAAVVAQAGTWQGFWKPTGVGPAVANITGDVGVG